MKAIMLERPGPPEVLQLVDLPMPSPGPGEVLVKAHAIGVGMPDVLVRSGRYNWMPKLPAIPGIEMAGVIERVGAEIAGLSIGDRVMVSARDRPERSGCYADFMVARPAEIYALPKGVAFEAAAALANYQVAYHMLHTAARVRSGETVLVLAAAGGVGTAALELAGGAGLKAIAVVSTPERAALARELGAFATIDRTRDNMAECVVAITNGRGVDLILDPVGGPEIGDRLKMLAPFGLLLSYGRLAGVPSGDLWGAMTTNFDLSPAVRRFTMHTLDDQPAVRRAATDVLLGHLAAGRIAPRIEAVLPLAQAAEAHRRLEAGRITGKLVLSPLA